MSGRSEAGRNPFQGLISHPPGITPPTDGSTFDTVRAAWDAVQALQFAKLEYTGRRSRAEVFTTWKDLVALQVESLGPAGVACWSGIWQKVGEAYKRHLSTPYLQRTTVRIDRPEEIQCAELERRLRPLLVQALPENMRRGLLVRGTLSCAEIPLETWWMQLLGRLMTDGHCNRV